MSITRRHVLRNLLLTIKIGVHCRPSFIDYSLPSTAESVHGVMVFRSRLNGVYTSILSVLKESPYVSKYLCTCFD